MARRADAVALAEGLRRVIPWANEHAVWAGVWAGTGHPKASYRVRPDGALEVRPGRPTQRLRLVATGFERMRGDRGWVYVLRPPAAPEPQPVCEPLVRDPREAGDRFQIRGYQGYTGGSQTSFEVVRTTWSEAVALGLSRMAAGEATAVVVTCRRDGEVLGRYRLRLSVERLRLASPPTP